MAACFSGVVRASKNQKLRGGVERLANYLLAQRMRQGDVEQITLPCEKRLLSSMLGMTPETLSRAFLALARYGVEVKGPVVTVPRNAALERFARPSCLIDNHMATPAQPVSKVEREQAGQRPAAARAEGGPPPR
jgi:CRP/FNR family transcriptional activator FtrB